MLLPLIRSLNTIKYTDITIVSKYIKIQIKLVVIHLKFIIGKIVDSNRNIVGYRVIDVESKEVKNYEANAVVKNFKQLNIENYRVRNGRLVCKGKDDSGYPIISMSDMQVIDNKVVILYKAVDGQYVVTDGTGGRIRSILPMQIATSDHSKIANISEFKEFVSGKWSRYKSGGNTSESKEHAVEESDSKQSSKMANAASKKNIKEKLLDLYNDIIGIKNLKDADTSRLTYYSCKEFAESTASAEDGLAWLATNIKVTTPSKLADSNLTANNSQSNSREIPISEKIDEDTREYKIMIETEDDRVVATGIYPADFRGDVIIPDGVTHIKKQAFRASNFRKCTLPNGVIYIGDGAFSGSEVEEVILPQSLRVIPHDCFFRSQLRVINLDYIVSIGNYSFTATKIEVADFKSGLTQVGIEAFSDCHELREFRHTDTLRKIRSSAFSSCIKLEAFDFAGVSEIEDKAFYDTALKQVDLSGEVTYIKPYTFESKQLAIVNLGDGCYKIADKAFDSDVPIVYTMPKSISNIGVRLLKKDDTVRCYYNSIAESSAKLAGCNIEYIDDTRQMSNAVVKASFVGMDIPKTIERFIQSAYSKEDIEYEFELDPSLKLINIDLNDDMLKFLGIESVSIPEGYEEKSKFKVLLEHYAKSCPLDGIGLSSIVMSVSSTISVTPTTIYDDGVSRIYEFIYSDHKFESKKAKYIVAVTGNTVRYCCLNNRYTSVYCRTQYSKDLTQILNMLVPGDTIGYDCTIGGERYEQIATKAGVKNKNNEEISLNIYQALFNCSIAVKLERNHLALILPVNGKVIKCASLGKAVWNNENDESYKTKYCVIEDIQDLKTNTIFEYGVNSPARDDELFSLLRKFSKADIENRLKEYSTVGIAEVSPYSSFRRYCMQHNIDKLTDLDLKGLGYLLAFPILEERTALWLDKYKGKTVVNAAKHEIVLKDNTVIRQYKTVKRMAMRNKLITGGDRTIYIFEVYFRNRRVLITSAMMDIDELFAMGKDMVIEATDNKGKAIYTNKDKFDVAKLSDFILLAEAFVNTQEKGNDRKATTSIWLAVYKPSGLYYLTYVYKSKNIVIPLIQIGDFEVILDYIDCSITKSASGYKLMTNTASYVYNDYINSVNPRRYGYQAYYGAVRAAKVYHDKLLAARALAIEGIFDIDKYMETGVEPVICHMFGINTHGEEVYNLDISEAKVEANVEANDQVVEPTQEYNEDDDFDVSDIDDLDDGYVTAESFEIEDPDLEDDEEVDLDG